MSHGKVRYIRVKQDQKRDRSDNETEGSLKVASEIVAILGTAALVGTAVRQFLDDVTGKQR